MGSIQVKQGKNMARKANPNDFVVEVDGVGQFRFGRRTFLDHTVIRADYVRLTGGDDADAELASYAALIAVVRHLCVSAPEGWDDLEHKLMTDQETDQAFELLRKVREQEDLFRQGAIEGSEAPGPGDGRNVSVLVPSEIQSPAI
jgi:hypothetical protein